MEDMGRDMGDEYGWKQLQVTPCDRSLFPCSAPSEMPMNAEPSSMDFERAPPAAVPKALRLAAAHESNLTHSC